MASPDSKGKDQGAGSLLDEDFENLPTQYYEKSEYIQTASGNKVNPTITIDDPPADD